MSRSTTGPVRPPGHAYRHAYGHGEDVVFSSPTGCFSARNSKASRTSILQAERAPSSSHADRADHSSRIRVRGDRPVARPELGQEREQGRGVAPGLLDRGDVEAIDDGSDAGNGVPVAFRLSPTADRHLWERSPNARRFHVPISRFVAVFAGISAWRAVCNRCTSPVTADGVGPEGSVERVMTRTSRMAAVATVRSKRGRDAHDPR